MPDVIVIGGGVIGLSIAWELAGHGLAVRVLEQGAFGREASWAGAGMLPPGNLAGAKTSEARLRGATHALWPEWSKTLTSTVGMDNGYLQCGGLEIRFPDSPTSQLSPGDDLAALMSEGVVVETSDRVEIRSRFPAVSDEIASAYFMPEFRQVRNPRHLQALQIGCAMRGVELIAGASVQKIQTNRNRIESVQAGVDEHRAAEFVIAGGAWSGQILSQLGVHFPIEPVKGQIVLLRATPLPFGSVLQLGRQYLVPRDDGRILIGSTEEHTGFDKRNTAEAVGDLIQFARRVVPSLKDAHFEKCWAGLRPCSASGRPGIGRVPQFSNASVATGHFRCGLHLSPITAVLIRQLLLNEPVLLPEECTLAG